LHPKRVILQVKEEKQPKELIGVWTLRLGIQLSSIASPIDLPNIFYDFARWELRPESMVNLDRLVETLNDNPNVTIELASHTDARGTAAANIELSQKRAQSVVDYLISKGIAADRLDCKRLWKIRTKDC
jgi:peptidoglycan-associated lipoprotein